MANEAIKFNINGTQVEISDDYARQLIAEITQTIEDNELVTAGSLTDLDTRLKVLEGGGSSST